MFVVGDESWALASPGVGFKSVPPIGTTGLSKARIVRKIEIISIFVFDII
jgi:hypothetical protein